MGKRIKLGKGFADYKRKYGTARALDYLVGFEGIKRGNWGKFKAKAKVAVQQKKKSFVW